MTENLYEPNCIRTFSGKYLNLADTVVEHIEPIDIAVGLARECRFAGHTKRFYSVAEHSMWCADKAAIMFPNDKELPFKLLLHDAHEAYIKDVPSPVKMFFKTDYEQLAKRLQDVIHVKYGVRLSHVDKERIHMIDVMALEWEFQHKKISWSGYVLSDQERIELFLKLFTTLCPVIIAL